MVKIFIVDVCELQPDVGRLCDEFSPQVLFYFDSFTGFCEDLKYLGCGGNENRFPNMTSCEAFCLIQGDARPSPSLNFKRLEAKRF